MKDEQLIDHIADQEIKNLYSKLASDDYYVYKEGLQMVEVTSDKLAVLEAINQSLDDIISDLGEHGKMNESLYDDHSQKYFELEKIKIEKQIADLRSQGTESKVFSEYMRKYDAQIHAYAEEFMAEMESDEALQRKILKELAKLEATPQATQRATEILSQIKKIKSSSYDFTNKINAEVNNLFSYSMGSGVINEIDAEIEKSVVSLAKTYIEFASIDLNSWNSGSYRNNVIVQLLAVSGICNEPSIAEWVIKNMVKPDDVTPTLSYNLACAYAKMGKKDQMLKWIRKAREGGKPTDQFEEDADFTIYLNDPEFKEVIK